MHNSDKQFVFVKQIFWELAKQTALNWALTLWDICTCDVTTPDSSTGLEEQQAQFAHGFRVKVIYVSVIAGVHLDTINEDDLGENNIYFEEVKASVAI